MIHAVFALLLLVVAAAAQPEPRWSPDNKYYAVNEAGRQVGKGQEKERFVVYTARGAQVAVAHVWEVEPNASVRVGIRGCESWGWVDNARLFCEGSINPSTGVYLVFDARSGRELAEYLGTAFTWSPDLRRIANEGNVPHFMPPEAKCDSIEIDGKSVFPAKADARHWFRSALVWSPDSRFVAAVDQRGAEGETFLVVVGLRGLVFEQKLRSQDPDPEWPPQRNYSLGWTGSLITVGYMSSYEEVALPKQ